MRIAPAALILAALTSPAAVAFAADVTLTSHDGSMTLTGELLSFDGQTYVVRSAIGEVSVDAFQVDCAGADCPQEPAPLGNFSIAGSKTVGSVLMPELISAWALEQEADVVRKAGETTAIVMVIEPDVEGPAHEVAISLSGSTAGAAALMAGDADLAVLSRPLTQAESDALGGQAPAIFALDALVPVVADDSFLRSISEQDLASVFSGGVANWADLGGPDHAIKMYMREADSGTRTAFDQIVMEAFIAELSDEAIILDSDEAIADAVAEDPFAIGIVSLAAARNARVLPILGICGIETEATPFTIKTEEYPLSRRIIVASRPNGAAAAAEFLGWIQSDAAQYEIADAGFADQRIEAYPVSGMGSRFATALIPGLSDTTLEQLQAIAAELAKAERLSVTFRFDEATGQPDARAQADILRLAEALKRGDWAGKQFVLAGFTDSEGSMNANRDRSLGRATEVRDALVAAGVPPETDIVLQGFGESSPLACNEIASGRAVNRRVEVWVRPPPAPAP